MGDCAEPNLLYYGDNLEILRRYVKDETVDLVYLDPPFNSNASYNVLFKERSGKRSTAQIHAFEDTWEWGLEAERAYEDIIRGGGKVADAMQAFRRFLGTNDMLAYLVMMAPRLVELHRVLKPTGSIYLHCDPTASHYLKVLLDAIYGPDRFLSELIWKRSHAHSSAKRYGPVHDTVLYYSKGQDYVWTALRLPYAQEYIDRYFKFDDGDGRGPYWTGDITGSGVRHGDTGQPWRDFNPTTKGRHWMVPPAELDKLDADNRVYWPPTKGAWPKLKRYLSEARGVPLQDVVDDVYGLATMGSNPHERLGYPTQKPEALLERIIKASSNEGDTVLDPFCGCGTTIVAAQRLNRRWIGIDVTHLAINLMKRRLRDTFGKDAKFEVVGEPQDLSGAEALAKQDPYQFQWWALDLVDARPTDQKKGADKGIDGRIPFLDDKDAKEYKEVIISVKAGHVTVSHVRDLRGVLDRESAAIGLLLSLEEPTGPMKTEAASAGFYHSPAFGKDFPRIQLMTVGELLDGCKPELPPSLTPDAAFKRAPRARKGKDGQEKLGV